MITLTKEWCMSLFPRNASNLSVAALTVVDMVKAVDKTAVITDVRVESKSGGRSGDWSR